MSNKIKCECGSEISKQYYETHLKSNKHINFLEESGQNALKEYLEEKMNEPLLFEYNEYIKGRIDECPYCNNKICICDNEEIIFISPESFVI